MLNLLGDFQYHCLYYWAGFNVTDVRQLTRLLFLLSIGGCHPTLSAHCSPRPTYVRLPDPPFGKSYFPKGVLINQCSGFCYYEGLTCLGAAFRNVTKDIHEIYYGMSGSIAGNLTAALLFNNIHEKTSLSDWSRAVQFS